MGPGRTVGGRYRIAEKIGRGGHGEVYRAQQLPLGRDVALKMILPEVYSGEEPERFVREASLVQTLDHPNIVRLFDFGVDDGGFPFMAFELLRGRTLEEEIEKGALPPDRVARITTQVLKALMDAHARGIIHRDIKPSNVFLVDFAGEKDFVKVLDFGVARRAVESTAQPKITSDGQIVGTPAYMAPEQVKDEPIGPPTDLYSLGLVIAEALSGEMVVRGRSEPEIWVKQASSSPVDIPSRVLASAFGRIVLRATHKHAAKRYASAEEMLRAVENAMMVGAGPTDEPQPATAAKPATTATTATTTATTAMPAMPAMPATVPLARPIAPITPRAEPQATTRGVRPPPPPVARRPTSMWSPTAIAAVAVTVVLTVFVVGIGGGALHRAPSRNVRVDRPGMVPTTALEAPPLPPVVDTVTALGWESMGPPTIVPGMGLVVTTGFVFAKYQPESLLLYVYDYRHEEDAVAEEVRIASHHEKISRRRARRLVIIDDGKKGRGEGPAIAAQLLP